MKKTKISAKRDEQKTKSKILMAARELFVKHGYAGTSIGKIAALANINHSLIFHHYESKALLWQAVKQLISDEANALTPILPDTSLPLYTFVTELFERTINFYRTHTDIIRMLNWQRLETESKSELSLSKTAESLKWSAAFKHYQDIGIIKSHLKPEFIVVFILSIISTAALDPIIFIAKEEDFKAYIDFSVENVMKVLV